MPVKKHRVGELIPETQTIAKSEEAIQSECFRYINSKYPATRGCLFAVPNGGKRGKREAATMKGTGTVPGIEDMIFVWCGTTTFIEMKRPGEKPSPEQRAIHATHRAHGFRVEVCDNKPHFTSIIEGIMNQLYWFYIRETNGYQQHTLQQAATAINPDADLNLGPADPHDKTPPTKMHNIMRGFYPHSLDDLKYEHNVFSYLLGEPLGGTTIPTGVWIAIDALTTPETAPRFIAVLKKFIYLRMDVGNNFHLEMNGTAIAFDQTAFRKIVRAVVPGN